MKHASKLWLWLALRGPTLSTTETRYPRDEKKHKRENQKAQRAISVELSLIGSYLVEDQNPRHTMIEPVDPIEQDESRQELQGQQKQGQEQFIILGF